ncbi:MAG: hypothetical protein HQ581_22355 [Planctomycetes bacterium]|nr:hypothetical protein [Planctomycetota bacterium]
MSWKYEELLRGNTLYAWVLDGDRVVCERKLTGINIRRPPPEVERTRQEFKQIVDDAAEVKRLEAALRQAAEMTEHEDDRTRIFNHCMQAAEAAKEEKSHD